MSANFIDPAPHAFVITPSDSASLPRNATSLLLCGMAATTATIHVLTAGGDDVTITFSVASLPAAAVVPLPIQVQKVFATGTTGITTIVGLFH